MLKKGICALGSLKNNLKICAFVVLVALAFGWHVKATHEAVEQARSVLIKKYEDALRVQEQKAQKASKELQASADKNRQDKDEKIDSISRQLDSALIRLRNRPSRSEAPNNPGSVQACTGRELYREDGEFLTREAARAEKVLAERDYYYQQYEEVRKKYGNSE